MKGGISVKKSLVIVLILVLAASAAGATVFGSDVMSKDITKSVLTNPEVPSWMKNSNGEQFEVCDDDGAIVSNGLQENPRDDALEANHKANLELDRENRMHQDAVEIAIIADSGQNHGPMCDCDLPMNDPAW